MTSRPQAEGRGGIHALYVTAAVLAGLAHVGVGFLYLISGLAVPFPVVAVGVLWWAILAVLGVFLVRRRSYLVLLVPVVALVTLLGALWFGGAVLGWTA